MIACAASPDDPPRRNVRFRWPFSSTLVSQASFWSKNPATDERLAEFCLAAEVVVEARLRDPELRSYVRIVGVASSPLARHRLLARVSHPCHWHILPPASALDS
jgi:hypothetical protein